MITNRSWPELSIAALAVCLALAGCAAPPVVSDISDSAVKVRANSLTKPGDLLAKANESCGIYGKTAIALSYNCLDQYCINRDYLFACKAEAPTQSMAPTVGAAPTTNGHVLGIDVSAVSDQLASTVGLDKPEGAFVANVTQGGAAQQAGVEQGDIILQLGYAAIDVPQRLGSAIAAAPTGQNIPLVVWRNRKRVTLTVRL